MNKRYFVGTVTIVGILGLTAYSIYLWKKQQKDEEESISHEEAMEMVRTMKENEKFNEPSFEELETEDDIRIINTDMEISVPEEDVVVPIKTMTPQEIDDSILDNSEIVEHEDEGVGKLRHDPNSDDALIQFHNMELAEWSPSDITFQTMISLFDIPFNPDNQGDNDLFDNLIDHRVEFFGNDSKWNERISFGDVVLYFARRADYNLDEGYKFWVEKFLSSNDLDDIEEDELVKVVQEIVEHNYYNDGWDTYGFFSLREDNLIEAEEIAEGNIDTSVTFEIEFNVFLKHWPEI